MSGSAQLVYAIRRLLLRWLRIRTRGVKVMLFNERGELLLIRNSYGDTRLFVLPGGGCGRGEDPAAAAVREVREELGIALAGLTPVSTHSARGEGRRDTVHLFRAITDAVPQPDGLEVVEARFCPLAALPPTTSEATLRRIAEHERQRIPDGLW